MGNSDLEERTISMPLNSFSKMHLRLEVNKGGEAWRRTYIWSLSLEYQMSQHLCAESDDPQGE